LIAGQIHLVQQKVVVIWSIPNEIGMSWGKNKKQNMDNQLD
jgi:hypothetical protein